MRIKPPSTVSVRDAAKLLGCSEQAVRNRLRLGIMPGSRPFGMVWRIPAEVMKAAVQELRRHRKASKAK